MVDKTFRGQRSVLEDGDGNSYSLGSATGAAAVTPNDSTVLDGVRALWIGTGGALVATIGGTDVTFTNVPDGTLLAVVATKVKSTGTTATDIVALS